MQQKPASILASIKDAVQDKITLAMMAAGILVLLIAPWLDGEHVFTLDGIWEGLSIMVAVVLVIAMNSVNDYAKDRQFCELASSVRDESCTVVRGKNGATQTVKASELVIGDLVILEAGAKIHADCILVQGQDVVLNESYYNDGQVTKVSKTAVNAENIDAYPDCFVLSQSICVTGAGKAIVCAVGSNSRRDTVAPPKIGVADQVTPLQQRLENLGTHFSRFGLYSALAIVVALFINWAICVFISDSGASAKIKNLIYIPITAIVIVIVAIPEGLPLSIGISLAYSSRTMKNNQILVKRPEAIEIMGTVEEIVTGKTGTLTTEDMKVAEWYCMSKVFKNSYQNTMTNYASGIPQRWQDITKDAVIFNSEARIEMGDDATYIPIGKGTEVSMLTFLQDNEVPIYEHFRDRRAGKVLFTIPHTSARARMTSVVRLTESPDTVRIVVKGAPEILLNNCDKTFDTEGGILPLEDGDRSVVVEKYLEGEWTNYQVNTDGKASGNHYRSLLYAYKDIPLEDFENMRASTNDFETEDSKSQLESELILIGVFAFNNPLRERVSHAIKLGRQGHLNIRMVTGDSEGTAKATALAAKILTAEDKEKQNSIMSGAQFRELVGGVGSVEMKDGSTQIALKNPEAFRQVASEIKVIYRATAEDKLALVTGLKTWADAAHPRGRGVAVTGEGVNDESSLEVADVGFSLGRNGTDIAKEASSIILGDDNFNNCIKTSQWGRNMYQNIRKFLQFQVTVNISCCLVILLGGLTLAIPPFNVVQLLWINLVMDIFAALALSTEPPSAISLRNRPIKDGDNIMTKFMWVQIFGMSLWISFITLVVYWSGKRVWGLHYPYGTAPGSDTSQYFIEDWQAQRNTTQAEGSDETISTAQMSEVDGQVVISPADEVERAMIYEGVDFLRTIVFTVFMTMHLFNEVNCRKVLPTEFNMFYRFFNNWLFLLILIAQGFMQWAITVYFTGLFQTTQISNRDWAVCVLMGLTTLVVSPVLKLLPTKFADQIPLLVNEKEEAKEDQTMRMFNNVVKGKVEVVGKVIDRVEV